MSKIDEKSANAIRILSADEVEKAKSGHPGFPLGGAPAIYELFAHHLNHAPADPSWFNRDRFILSGGHGSAMLYAVLHLFGYPGVTLDELKQFRQWGSLTPGHPEYRHTKGVEATTGPLGAGMAMAVGFAIAEAHLAARFNKNDIKPIDHYTFAFGGDGCMMEGISSEVFSLAGTLGLGKLIVLYDSNSITIEGGTDIAFTENVVKRVEAYGFQVLTVDDGNDTEKIGKAIAEAKKDLTRPSFIKITTKIGFGVPGKEGTSAVHGEPLGTDSIAALRKSLGWESDVPFEVPDDVYANYKQIADAGLKKRDKWDTLFKEYEKKYPEDASLLKSFLAPIDPAIFDKSYWSYEKKADASRNISGRIINELKDKVPNLIGGSADLAPSNKTAMKDAGDFDKNDYAGRNLHFGVRELGMTGIGNGIALHGGLHPYIATFFVFADYLKPMLRLSALMGLPLVSVLTHDSIGVGEDGPTHEPIEQLSMLRSMPNINVWRPADEFETRVAWKKALTSAETPSVLALTRQNLAVLTHSGPGAERGAYIIEKESGPLALILIASGSEVALAIEAKEALEAEGVFTRVVSAPSLDVFETQPQAYKDEILPKDARKRIAIEAGSSASWGKIVGLDGAYVTIDRFGASAPAGTLFKEFGFTKENIIDTAKEIL